MRKILFWKHRNLESVVVIPGRVKICFHYKAKSWNIVSKYFCEVGAAVSCWSDIKQSSFVVSFSTECIGLLLIRWWVKEDRFWLFAVFSVSIFFMKFGVACTNWTHLKYKLLSILNSQMKNNFIVNLYKTVKPH